MNREIRTICPSCGRRATFTFLGWQRWPAEVAAQIGMPRCLGLWTCGACSTNLTRVGLRRPPEKANSHVPRAESITRAEYNAVLEKVAVELARRLHQVADSAAAAGPDMYAPGGIPERVRENVLVSCLRDIRSIEGLLALTLGELGAIPFNAPKRARRAGQ